MLNRLILCFSVVLLTVSPCFAASNLLLMGVGGPVAAASYTGPGDLVSGAVGWWGLRCYNAAYSGKVAEIWDTATGTTDNTTASCSGGTVSYSGSSGCTNAGSCQPLATTCATACNVATLYDQSGNAHNLTQTGNGARPAFTQNCINTTLPCLTFTAANSQFLIGASAVSTTAQPYTVSIVAKRTGQFTSAVNVFEDDTSNAGVWTAASANTGEMRAGSIQTYPASDNATHAIQDVFNGVSSVANVDNTQTATSPGTGNIGSGTLDLGGNFNFFQGTVQEVGLWGVAFSNTQQTNMCHNQFSYWGTATSC